MLSDITRGNAKHDGREFGCWFVGQIESWCNKKNIPFDEREYRLRNTGDIEIKWGMYKKGDVRDRWAACSDRTAMSVLIKGDFTFTFRNPHNHSDLKEIRLSSEGDYVMWHEDVEHTWRMDADSEILTLRWVSKK